MKTILIVDDLQSVRLYHQIVLAQAGFRTLSAVDGYEALTVLAGNDVDLAMLDVLMPRMDGVEFLKRARAMQRYNRLPLLVISSEAMTGTGNDFSSVNDCEVLRKPLLPSVLLEAVNRLID